MIEVIQGEKQQFNIDLTSNNKPFDLTSATEIVVCFKADAIIIEKKLSLAEVSIVGSAELGQIQGDLLTTDTDSFAPVSSGDVEVVITFGAGDIRKSQIFDGFKVLAKICP